MLSQTRPGEVKPDPIKITLPVPPATAARERRSEPRFPTNETALLLAPSGPIERIKILDVSKKGMRIQTELNLDPGTMVRIFGPRTIVFGEMRYRNIAEHEFVHGVAVESAFPNLPPEEDACLHGLSEVLHASRCAVPSPPGSSAVARASDSNRHG